MKVHFSEQIVCAQCGEVARGIPGEYMVCLTNASGVPTWGIHSAGGCNRDFFGSQRKQLLPIIDKMEGYDARTWAAIRSRIGTQTWNDPALKNPGRFTSAVQDMLLELGRTPMGSACKAVGITDEQYFTWYETIAAVLRAFHMMPRQPAPDPVGPQLRLVPTH